MDFFPAPVQEGMHKSGAAATCVPVQLDDGVWEAALFLQVDGSESERDRRVLTDTRSALPVVLETDFIDHALAGVVLLRLEVSTFPEDPLVIEILLTPGNSKSHFESLQLLSHQPRLVWFFGDGQFRIIHRQQQPLSAEIHDHFAELAKDVVTHDALIRCSSRYDANAAVTEIVSHYELRTATETAQTPYIVAPRRQ